jgi:tetratricopeptide (TPR) repeat protein
MLALVLLGVTAKPACAQTTAELERGRDLFWQALSLEVAGDWAGALSRLQQVAQIKMTPQVRFHLARCKEQLGRLTEALGDYRLAEYEATKVNAAELNEIKAGRQSLERRVPKLVVTVSPALIDATVELDAIALGSIRLGKPTPIDPGDHMLLVRLPDGQSFVKRIAVVEASTTRILLTPPPGFEYQPTQHKAPEVPPNTAQKVSAAEIPTWAWVAGGVGATGLVSASLLWYMRARAIDDLDGQCNSASNCPPNLRSTQSRGEAFSIAAPIAFGVGLVGLGTAAYGILRRPSPEAGPGSRRVGVSFRADQQFAGVRLSGAF